MAQQGYQGNQPWRGKPANQQQQQQRRFRDQRRDAERMLNYNKGVNKDWSNDQEVEDRYAERVERIPPAKSKDNRPRGRGPPPKPTTVESAPKDELIYEGPCLATTPVSMEYGHNLDYAGFIELVAETWRNACSQDGRIERQVPYPMFQHVCVGMLHMHIYHHQRFINGDVSIKNLIDTDAAFGGPDYTVPKVIKEYLDSICAGITPTGERIKVNFPKVSNPLGPIEEIVTENLTIGAAPSGTFGIPTDANHNVYECYPSPFVTRRLIERTADNNQTGHWNPFPPGWIPPLGIINSNLLGYQPLNRVHPDAANKLRNCAFQDDDTFLGRIAYSPYAATQVQLYFSQLKGTEMVKLEYKERQSTAIFAFKELSTPIDVDTALASVSADIKCPYALGQPLVNKAHYFGLKRSRSRESPGIFLTVNDEYLPGWLDTCDDNFKMVGAFVPRNLMRDKPTLREAAHLSVVSTGYIKNI